MKAKQWISAGGLTCVLTGCGRPAATIVVSQDSEGSSRAANSAVPRTETAARGRQGDPDLESRFRREAQLSARLRGHAGVVEVFDIDIASETGELYFTMKFINGASVRKRIEAGLDRRRA